MPCNMWGILTPWGRWNLNEIMGIYIWMLKPKIGGKFDLTSKMDGENFMEKPKRQKSFNGMIWVVGTIHFWFNTLIIRLMGGPHTLLKCHPFRKLPALFKGLREYIPWKLNGFAPRKLANCQKERKLFIFQFHHGFQG